MKQKFLVVLWPLCVALLLASCSALRDRTVVKKETAEAAATLGLTSSDLLLAADGTIDLANYVYDEYYITTTLAISSTSVEAMLKPLSYGVTSYSGDGESVFERFERLSQGRLKPAGANTRVTKKYVWVPSWLKRRGQGSWTSVDVAALGDQTMLYDFDGKVLTGTLIVLQATYR
jgi:hypothetical protein